MGLLIDNISNNDRVSPVRPVMVVLPAMITIPESFTGFGINRPKIK